MHRDLYNTIKAVPSIAPVVITNANTAQVGAVVDRLGYEGVLYVVQTGTLSDADATTTFLMEHGDASNLSDAAAVPDSELFGTEAGSAVTFTNDGVTRKLGYRGTKRYTRLTITPAANDAGSIPISAMCLLTGSRKGPETAP